jgi:hypothetical protein
MTFLSSQKRTEAMALMFLLPMKKHTTGQTLIDFYRKWISAKTIDDYWERKCEKYFESEFGNERVPF